LKRIGVLNALCQELKASSPFPLQQTRQKATLGGRALQGHGRQEPSWGLFLHPDYKLMVMGL